MFFYHPLMLYTDLHTVNDSDQSPEPSEKKVSTPKAPRKSSKKSRGSTEKTPSKETKGSKEEVGFHNEHVSDDLVPKAKKQKYKPKEDEVPPKWFINYVKFKQEKKVAKENEEMQRKRKAEEEKQLRRQEELQKKLLELQAQANKPRDTTPTPQNSPVKPKAAQARGLSLSSIFPNRPR